MKQKLAQCNGTQQWLPQKLVVTLPPNHSTLQWHPTMAPTNGTTSTAPCNGTLVPRPIRQSGSSSSPLLEVRTAIVIAIWGNIFQHATWIHLNDSKIRLKIAHSNQDQSSQSKSHHVHIIILDESSTATTTTSTSFVLLGSTLDLLSSTQWFLCDFGGVCVVLAQNLFVGEIHLILLPWDCHSRSFPS